MRILWLGRSVDLAQDAGDRIYSFNLFAAIARCPGVTLCYVGLTDIEQGKFVPPPSSVDWHPVFSKQNSSLKFLYSSFPMSGAKIDVPAFRGAMVSKLDSEEWDVVVLDHYALAIALPLIEASRFKGLIVHVAHDFETDVTRDIANSYSGNPFKKVLLKLNAKRTEAAEKALAAKSDVILTLTEKDARSFKELNRNAQSLIVPPGYAGPVVASREITDRIPRRVVSIGSFTWLAKRMNLLEFALEADEFFFQRGIELRVIGKIPLDFHEIKSRQWKATKFLGFVEDPASEFAHARMGLVFDRTGGGFKLKMLDYIFQRLPIAGYAHALEGLPASVSPHVISSLETAPLLENIASALNSPERLQAMQVGAFDAAQGLFDWDQNGRRFVETISRLRAVQGSKQHEHKARQT